MKLLLTGPSGQVGHELLRTLAPLGEIVAVDRSAMDLSDAARIREVIRQQRPDLVVNAAAYTAVDRAEVERETAFKVNATAPRVMAEALRETGGVLVHYSTDYVFDGAKRGPYFENDRPNPLSAYGRSKLEGEQAIRASGVPHLILRTSWVYGKRGRNFLVTMLSLFEEKPELRIVDDQIGAPTWCRWIAQATGAVLARCAANGSFRSELSGTYHMTAAGSTTWYGFASAIRELRYGPGSAQGPRLIPIPSSGYPLPARRPLNSVLSTDRLRSVFGVQPSDWREQLRQCFEQAGDIGSAAGPLPGMCSEPGAD
jgi:dTDP-4-dehydrorhamnose reductase